MGDTNGASDVFVRDRALHRTNMLTRGGGAGVRNQGSFDPDISADGRYVAFTSAAGNLVRRDTNGRPDVFVRDRHTGTTCLVSVGLDGESADGASYRPEISADGRFIAFLSGAGNLVQHDTNRHADGFVARVPASC